MGNDESDISLSKIFVVSNFNSSQIPSLLIRVNLDKVDCGQEAAQQEMHIWNHESMDFKWLHFYHERVSRCCIYQKWCLDQSTQN